jgi:SAM-dependent methyltransferase
MTVEECVACGSPAVVTTESCTGYVEGTIFTLAECERCSTVASWPRSNEPDLYDAIYRHSSRLQGYARYDRYARLARRMDNPLDELAEQEDVYWGVREALRLRAPQGQVAEVGSGLGYLTAAMRRAGLDAMGIDLSAEAVRRASEAFGPHYVQMDLTRPSRSIGPFEMVIALELIEHVVDPFEFLQSIGMLVADDGAVVLSTPNRSIYPASAKWRTDSPPVHLTWFTENGIAELAARCGWHTEFIDFAPYHQRVWESISSVDLHVVPGSKLNAELVPLGTPARYRAREVLATSRPVARLAKRVIGPVRRGRVRLIERSHTMVAVLTR